MSLTLKEVFMFEESAMDSKFVESMKKQLSRVKTEKMVDHIATVYDRIVTLIKKHDDAKQQEVFSVEDPFFKFHYRLAKKDYNEGKLDAIPDGRTLAAERKKFLAQRQKDIEAKKQQTAKLPPKTPEEEAKAMRNAVYGSPNRYKSPLGT